MNTSSNQPHSNSHADNPPGDVTRLVNIVKDKIEEADVDDDVQKEIAIILNLLAEFKEQDVLENKRHYLELALTSLASEHPNMGFVKGLRNELELNSAKYATGLPSLIKRLAGPTPISAMICGLVATLVISPLIYITIISLTDINVILGKHFDMLTINILFAASFLGGVVSLISRLDQFASLRLYNPNLVLLNSFCKPLIGVALSMFGYAIVVSGVLPIDIPKILEEGNVSEQESKYYLLIWAIGFLSGFSERFSKDIISGAEDMLSSKTNTRQS